MNKYSIGAQIGNVKHTLTGGIIAGKIEKSKIKDQIVASQDSLQNTQTHIKN